MLSCMAMFMNNAKAYTHEVWQSGSTYYWKTFDVTRGNSSDLATAIQGAIGTGNRDVHILCGGTLAAQINLQPGLNLYCHNNTFNKNHGGYGFFIDGSGPLGFYDMTLNNNTNMGIRTSRASDIVLWNVKIYGGSIGARIDSHPSRPYEDGRWVSNLTVQDCRFENTSSHGIETYGVDGFTGYGIVARNCGECGVLLNKTKNGTIGTVDAYRCCYGGGYAGLRYANNCDNIVANNLIARECGRGYFVLTGTQNTTLKNCTIEDCTDIGIWMQDVANCVVQAGCTNSGVAVSGSGSYANVSSSCGGGTTYYQLQNRNTGLFLDGMGRTANGSDVGQYGNTSHVNSQWILESAGSYYKLQNLGTGLYLDGMGRTANGSNCGQWSNSSSYNQQWERISTGSYYQLKNRATGLILDGMGYTSNGSACGLWANTTHYNSHWSFITITKSAKLTEELTEYTESGYSLYPTIIDNTLTIKLNNGMEKGATLSVYGSTGNAVLTDYIVGEDNTIDLSGLSQGIYFVKISNGEDTLTEKVMKK